MPTFTVTGYPHGCHCLSASSVSSLILETWPDWEPFRKWVRHTSGCVWESVSRDDWPERQWTGVEAPSWRWEASSRLGSQLEQKVARRENSQTHARWLFGNGSFQIADKILHCWNENLLQWFSRDLPDQPQMKAASLDTFALMQPASWTKWLPVFLALSRLQKATVQIIQQIPCMITFYISRGSVPLESSNHLVYIVPLHINGCHFTHKKADLWHGSHILFSESSQTEFRDWIWRMWGWVSVLIC